MSYQLGNNNFRKYSIAIFILSWILFSFSIASFVIILITQPILQFQLDSKGFYNFLGIFKPSLQIGTASIVFFTLWLTLERMRQTDERYEQAERQIKITEANSRFNNYHKHLEEFKSYLKSLIIFRAIEEIKNIQIDVLAMPLYNSYFNKDYRNFEPNLNEGAKAHIINFISQINISGLCHENQDLNSLKIDELKPLLILIDKSLNEICNILTNHDLPRVKFYFMYVGGGGLDLAEERYKTINNLYWAFSLYESMLAFDGIYHKECENFSINYHNYRNQMGLETTN